MPTVFLYTNIILNPSILLSGADTYSLTPYEWLRITHCLARNWITTPQKAADSKQPQTPRVDAVRQSSAESLSEREAVPSGT